MVQLTFNSEKCDAILRALFLLSDGQAGAFIESLCIARELDTDDGDRIRSLFGELVENGLADVDGHHADTAGCKARDFDPETQSRSTCSTAINVGPYDDVDSSSTRWLDELGDFGRPTIRANSCGRATIQSWLPLAVRR